MYAIMCLELTVNSCGVYVRTTARLALNDAVIIRLSRLSFG